MKVNPCKIEIEIDEHYDWILKIDGVEMFDAKRFSIELDEAIKPITYSLEVYAGLIEES
jgi:hypothetical protein